MDTPNDTTKDVAAEDIALVTIGRVTDEIMKIFTNNGIKTGFVTFISDKEPIIALHGDFYESVKLVCQGSERMKEQIIKDLRITIPGRT